MRKERTRRLPLNRLQELNFITATTESATSEAKEAKEAKEPVVHIKINKTFRILEPKENILKYFFCNKKLSLKIIIVK